MAKIRLYGDLKQYGDKFNMNVETAAEALNGLYCQIKGLKKQIMDGFFRVRINGVDMNEGNLQFGLHSRIPQNAVIHIVPKTEGAKGGAFRCCNVCCWGYFLLDANGLSIDGNRCGLNDRWCSHDANQATQNREISRWRY